MDREVLENIEKEYVLQRKLEDYITKRQLFRPKTTYFVITILALLLVLLIGLLVVINLFLIKDIIWQIVFNAVYISLLIEVYIRFFLVQTVKCYQRYASEQRRRRCICVPSCSEYAICVLKRQFIVVALFKIRKRLKTTCQGDDYKIDKPYKKFKLPIDVEN